MENLCSFCTLFFGLGALIGSIVLTLLQTYRTPFEVFTFGSFVGVLITLAGIFAGDEIDEEVIENDQLSIFEIL